MLELVEALAAKISKDAKEELNGQAIANALYGLKEMSCADDEVRELIKGKELVEYSIIELFKKCMLLLYILLLYILLLYILLLHFLNFLFFSKFSFLL